MPDAQPRQPEIVEPTRFDWPKVTREALDKNAEKGGWPARHAIAWAFVFALHDLADAIRGSSL